MSKISTLKALIKQLREELQDATDLMETFEPQDLAGTYEEGEKRLQAKYDALEKVEEVFMELGI